MGNPVKNQRRIVRVISEKYEQDPETTVGNWVTVEELICGHIVYKKDRRSPGYRIRRFCEKCAEENGEY